MNKFLILLLLTFSNSCEKNTGNLKVVTELPSQLEEASGTETVRNSNLIWLHNDSGNKARLYGMNKKGKIIKELKIDAENHDWEDLTSDDEGNIYIGDFGNNDNERKDLSILKVKASKLDNDKKIDVKRISFYFENQDKFPPKKKNMYFDCEAFFYFKDNLYLFTKSRVKDDHGKTSLYKIPTKKGRHKAHLIGTYNTCKYVSCWITSADISNDGKKVALLTQKAVWVFTNFENDNFFSGSARSYDFNFNSQKEGICFKDNNTVYITDEDTHNSNDSNLYEFKLK